MANSYEMRSNYDRVPGPNTVEPAPEDDVQILPTMTGGCLPLKPTEDFSIHPEVFPSFVKLLQDDDVEQFKLLPADEVHLYLRGQFARQQKHGCFLKCPDDEETGIRLNIPFNLAVGFAAVKIVEEFIAKGVDLSRKDLGEVNVLHVLAMCSAERRQNEDEYVFICQLVMDNLNDDLLVSLCQQEDADGMRPLELASKLCACGIFRQILERPGYIRGKDTLGIGLSGINAYTMREYEPSSSLKRLIRHPLYMLVFADDEGLESIKRFEIFDLPIVKKWTAYKIRYALPFLLIWWTFRILYISSVAAVDSSVLLNDHACGSFQPNMTPPTGNKSTDQPERVLYDQCSKLNNMDDFNTMYFFQKSIEIISWAMIVVDLVEACICQLHKDRRRAFRDMGIARLSYSNSYRFSQFILYILGAIAPQVAQGKSAGESFLYLLYLKACQLPLCIVSFLYFVEFMPIIGIFAITLHCMVDYLLVFLVFLIPVKFLFAKFFMFFASDNGFNDFSAGIYLLFLLDMGSFDFGTDPTLIVKIVHVFYFLVMLILLFNYLIAILSLVAEQTDQHRKAMVQLRRLHMIFLLDERLTYWLWAAYYRLVSERKPVVFYAKAPIPVASEK